MSSNFQDSEPVESVDTLVIGAGLLGSSVAMHLAQLSGSGDRVSVLDFDLQGSFSSSELNAGGVRATWVQPVNIQISKCSIDYFSTVAKDIGYRACGYLWLHPADRIEAALGAAQRQNQLGWPVLSWDIAELQKHFPFLDKTADIAGALFAPRDGLVNPNLLKQHYRQKARSLGVRFNDWQWVRDVQWGPDGIKISCNEFTSPLSETQKIGILSGKTAEDLSILYRKKEWRASRMVNCTGAWSAGLAKLVGYASTSKAIRRQISIFDCRDLDLTPYGMVVDTSGVYFHPEAQNGLAGYANADEPEGVRFNYDGEKFFENRIWPALYERSTSFERLKHVTGWAGLYEVSPDESAVIGEVRAAASHLKGRVFEAHSFSGHGAMQSYGAGLGLAELMVKDGYQTLDLGSLSGDRFEQNKWVHETLVI